MEALARGVDILIATPGRLNDLIGQGYVHLDDVQTFVLDEADRMLDMGFVHDVKRVIAKLQIKKQTLLFSATMPPEIRQLVDSLLVDPVKVAVTPVSSTVDAIRQSVYFVDKANKRRLLTYLLRDGGNLLRPGVHPHQARGGSGGQGFGAGRHSRHGHPWQQVSERPAGGAARPEGREPENPGYN